MLNVAGGREVRARCIQELSVYTCVEEPIGLNELEVCTREKEEIGAILV